MGTACGCGCSTIVILGALIGGVLWLGPGMLEQPPRQHAVGSPADGRRAQQKLYEISVRHTGPRRDGRGNTVTLSEQELNALVSRHASSDELPLNEMGVRLIGNGVVELTGRLPLHAPGLLPQRLVPAPLWVRLQGHVRLESGTARGDRQHLRLDTEQFSVGRRRFPVAVPGMIPGAAGLQAIRWPVPAAVESLTVEAGRLSVTTRP